RPCSRRIRGRSRRGVGDNGTIPSAPGARSSRSIPTTASRASTWIGSPRRARPRPRPGAMRWSWRSSRKAKKGSDYFFRLCRKSNLTPFSLSTGAAQVPRFGPREGLDAGAREREADARPPDAGPRQPRAHAIAAVPVRGARAHTREDALRALAVSREDAGGEPVGRVVHQGEGRVVVRGGHDADEGAEGLVAHHRHRVVHGREDRRLEPAAGARQASPAEEDPGDAW